MHNFQNLINEINEEFREYEHNFYDCEFFFEKNLKLKKLGSGISANAYVVNNKVVKLLKLTDLQLKLHINLLNEKGPWAYISNMEYWTEYKNDNLVLLEQELIFPAEDCYLTISKKKGEIPDKEHLSKYVKEQNITLTSDLQDFLEKYETLFAFQFFMKENLPKKFLLKNEVIQTNDYHFGNWGLRTDGAPVYLDTGSWYVNESGKISEFDIEIYDKWMLLYGKTS